MGASDTAQFSHSSLTCGCSTLFLLVFSCFSLGVSCHPLTILLGLSAEMINTAIEAMTDLITLEQRKDAKIAKDVSAGMMLIVAMGAIVVGCVVFLPRVLVLFFR